MLETGRDKANIAGGMKEDLILSPRKEPLVGQSSWTPLSPPAEVPQSPNKVATSDPQR